MYSLGCFPSCALFCIHWHSVSSVILLPSHWVAVMLLQLFIVSFGFNYLNNSVPIILYQKFTLGPLLEIICEYIKPYGSSTLTRSAPVIFPLFWKLIIYSHPLILTFKALNSHTGSTPHYPHPSPKSNFVSLTGTMRYLLTAFFEI